MTLTKMKIIILLNMSVFLNDIIIINIRTQCVVKRVIVEWLILSPVIMYLIRTEYSYLNKI